MPPTHLEVLTSPTGMNVRGCLSEQEVQQMNGRLSPTWTLMLADATS